jgi:hypothetical protein
MDAIHKNLVAAAVTPTKCAWLSIVTQVLRSATPALLVADPVSFADYQGLNERIDALA